MGDQERRSAARHAHVVDVELHKKTERIPLRALDVSRHGLFVSTSDPPPLHHAVLLTVCLGGGPFDAMATVVRRVTDDELKGPSGVGLKLFCLGAHAKLRWDDFVATLGNTVALPTRKSSTAVGACFLVQPDDVGALRTFFEKTITSPRVFHLSPAIRTIGSPVSVVLVHPVTHEEMAFPAAVVEFNPDHPLRMGVRFAPVDTSVRRAFKAFLGAPTAMPADVPQAPLVEGQPRTQWTEYAYYSPKLRARRDPSGEILLLEDEVGSTPATPAELDVIEGELMELPELKDVDKGAMFDFAWQNEDDT